ncbi:MAG: extracellular solute-binding protein [Clostridiales bacterium]|nr:extracellular solute-binding protein [Clostridiales bacterium]MDD7774940.1 extracellular solute-binding protein [Eubacteriales bacterium]
MKYTKRVLVLLLCAAMLLPACGKDTQSETESTTGTDTVQHIETEPEETTRATMRDNLPSDLRYNGETVVYYVRGDENCIAEFQIEEMTGEVVNDALYQRNIDVSERLNVKLETAVGNGWQAYGATIGAIRASIQASDGAYDVIAGWSAQIPSLSLEGLFLDAQTIPYLDLEMPWWNQSCRTELKIGNRLFFVTGDLTQTIIESMYVYTFNQKVADDLGIEDPYTVVNEGRWTLDYVRKQTADLGTDRNGDGKMDKYDSWGLATYQVNGMDNYMQGARVSMMGRDAEDVPVLDVDMDRMTSLVEKVYALCFENPGCYVEEGGNYDITYAVFKADRALYTTMMMSQVRTELADMESDFGILPYPKLDETQSAYGTRVQDGLTIFAVPIDCQKVEITGAVMEAMAAENYRKVTPAVYDVAMKTKYSRDPASAAMIDLIQQSVLINFESIYNESIGSPWFVMRDLMGKKSRDFTSYWASHVNKIERELGKAVEQIRAIDQ